MSKTTYPKGHFLHEIASGEPIPLNVRAYFERRTLNEFYNYIVTKFLEQEQHGLTRAELARRIEKGPDQISRLLGAPGNWTLETISDLLLGISAEEFVPYSRPLLQQPTRNLRAHDLLNFDEIEGNTSTTDVYVHETN